MNQKLIIQIVVGILGVVLVIFLYMNTSRPKIYDWSENLRASSKTPYGTFMIHEMLKSGRDSTQFEEIHQPIEQVLSDTTLLNSSYIFLGQEWYYSYDDIESLLDYVARGNNAYIIANYYPTEILDYTYEYTLTFYNVTTDSVIYATAISDTLLSKVKYTHIENWKPTDYEWSYADDYLDSGVVKLGFLDDGLGNFYRFALGDGALYVHLTPILFTNYYLQDEDKLEYTERVFADLSTDHVYWDEFSQIPREEVSNGTSPLVFIMSQPSLRWAWYLLIIMGLIYLILYTKRRQGVIPVLPRMNNSSIEFVETMASLYYQQSSYLKIANHEKDLFLSYFRLKYGLSTNKIDEDFLIKAELKSGVSKGEIDYILKENKRLNFITNISEKDLTDYHKLIEAFHRKSK